MRSSTRLAPPATFDSVSVGVFLLALGLFFALEFSAPRFADYDEVFFKAAGRNLAAGGGFAAPELENYLHLDPPLQRIYFAHPPLYSWLFGQAARVGGFNWRTCVGYDALITAALALCVPGLAGHIWGRMELAGRPSLIVLLPAFGVLFWRQPARPDELAMLLGYANVWWLLARRWNLTTAGVSGLLAGLALCTSTGVLLAFAPFLIACWCLRVDHSRWLLSLAVSAAGAVAALGCCLLPLFLAEPNFYRQFFQHAAAQVTKSSPWERIRDAWQLTWQVAPRRIFGLAATLPLCLAALVRSVRTRPRLETIALHAAPFLGFALLFVLRPVYTYWWFLQPWFLVVATLFAARCCVRPEKWRMAPALWITAWLSVSLVWPAKEYYARLTLPADQQIDFAQERLRAVIPPHATVMTADAWWLLASDHATFAPGFALIDDVARIDYYVASSNGTGAPGKWIEPLFPRYKAWLRDEFEVVQDDLPKETVSIFGRRISRSAYGFGAIVLRRRAALVSTSADSLGNESRQPRLERMSRAKIQ